MYRFLIALISLSASFFSATAAWTDSISWHATVEAAVSGGDHSPFWFETNRQGLPSIRTDNGYVMAGARMAMQPTDRFSWSVAADIAVPWRGQSPWIIQQLYGEVRYRCLNAMIGSKEMWGAFNNPRLSSGNLLYSGNARPIPQVRLGIFDYADIWGTKGWLGVKGYIAAGKFTDSRWERNWVEPGTRYSQGVLYNSRGIWIRNGNEKKFPLVFEAGLEMATQFGGEIYNYKGPGSYLKMPENFKAWVKSFIPMRGDNSTPDGEQANVQGNMVGAWQFRLSWTDPSGWAVKGYYEHFFEDHSMLYIDFPWKDGLYGLEVQLPDNPFVSEFVGEYLYLKNQSGPVLWNKDPNIPDQVSGGDDYYAHYLYGGWQHWGNSIGTPLCLSPIFNNPHRLGFHSSRVIAWHFGLGGSPLPNVDWRVLLSFTRSWGSYNWVFSEVEQAFNGLAEVTWRPAKLPGWEGTLGLGLDHGSLIGNTAGVMLRISKSWH